MTCNRLDRHPCFEVSPPRQTLETPLTYILNSQFAQRNKNVENSKMCCISRSNGAFGKDIEGKTLRCLEQIAFGASERLFNRGSFRLEQNIAPRLTLARNSTRCSQRKKPLLTNFISRGYW